MGRNWYTTAFSDKEDGDPGYGWIVIYAYGATVEEAFASGFHRSDVQPHPDDDYLWMSSADHARDIAIQLNSQERQRPMSSTYTPTNHHQER